jgi:signal transduction histidine kinase
VEKDSPATLQAAQDLGRTAVKLGVETLSMAKMHEQALAVLIQAEPYPIGQNELKRKATMFFTEAVMPIEGTHHAARADSANLVKLSDSLHQRTTDLATSKRELKEQIDMRQSAEVTLKASQYSSGQVLKDSQLLELHLKEMTRKIISATENERRAMSLRLNDEIAQTLLGINIRMIALKNEIAANQFIHNQEITVIQQLVEESAEMVKHLAYEFSVKHH